MLDFVPWLLELLQPFQAAMTRPTFEHLASILGGWILCRRRSIVSAAAVNQAAGTPLQGHLSAYHRVFAAARWSLDAVGLAVLKLAARLSPKMVYLAVDDTLCRRGGRRVYGAGMHYDPLATGRKWSNAHRSIKSRGHCWVCLGVVLSLGDGFCLCVPVLFRLYLNHKSAQACGVAVQSKAQLALEMVNLACAALPDRSFHLLADSGYATTQMLNALPETCQLTGRWTIKAALYAPAPPRVSGARGRPRVRGGRLPGPLQMLAHHCVKQSFNVFGLRGSYRVASCLACVHDAPGRLLRIVASQPLDRKGQPVESRSAVLISTATDASARRIMRWYAMRWSIEVSFRDAKQQMGVEQVFGWSEQAARRLVPTLMLSMSLIAVNHVRDVRHGRTKRMPFAHLLAATRRRLAYCVVLRQHPADARTEKYLEPLLNLLRVAA